MIIVFRDKRTSFASLSIITPIPQDIIGFELMI